MISRAIIKRLKVDATFTSLCGGSAKLFAEVGQGEPSVIVKLNGNSPIIEDSGLRVATIQLLVSGYGVEAGEAIAEAAIAQFGLLDGVQITDETYTFTIKSVSHVNGPTLITWQSANSFSANFIFGFHQLEVT